MAALSVGLGAGNLPPALVGGYSVTTLGAMFVVGHLVHDAWCVPYELYKKIVIGPMLCCVLLLVVVLYCATKFGI